MPTSAHRLHPWSWLFLVGGKLKTVGVPLLAFLVFGRREDGWAVWAAAPMAVFGLWALVAAAMFRYRVADGELLIRAGVLDRTDRHIPVSRIAHISQRRNGLHRLLGVTEVHLESSAGDKPEAVMRVLSVAAAAELEQLLRGAPGQAAPAAAEPASPILHRLRTAEIVRLGLCSNSGLLVVGMAFAAVSRHQEAFTQLRHASRVPIHWVAQQLGGPLAAGHWSLAVFGAMVLALAGLATLAVFSVALALFQFHGFTLEQRGPLLTARHGLSTQVVAAARLARLQRWVLEENWRHRLLGRCRLRVTVAGARRDKGDDEHGAIGLTALAPIATPAQARQLLAHTLPGLDWDAVPWQAVPRSAFLRRVLGPLRWALPLLLALGAIELAVPFLPAPTLVAAAVLAAGAALLWHARAWCRFAAYAQVGELLLWREGVFTRRWSIVPASRVQSLQLLSSPLDRRLGLVSLAADTQGYSGRRGGALQMHCMATSAARAIRQQCWAQLHAPRSLVAAPMPAPPR